MYKRLCGLILVGVFFLPAAAAAQDAENAPALMARIRSFDHLIQTFKVVAKAVDKEEVGQQVEQLIKLQVGPDGLEGIDTKRSWGVYGKLGGSLDSMSGVLMIPISDQKKFLALLSNLNYPATKKGKGLYVIDENQLPVPIKVGIRFANKYAYVTALNLEAIEPKNLVAPGKIFPRNATSLVSATVRIDRIPKAVKDIAIGKMEEELAKEKNKPAKSPSERRLRDATLDTIADLAADFLNEATEVSVSLDVNAKSKMITTGLFVNSKANSDLSKQIAAMSAATSLFGGMLADTPGMGGLVHFKLPTKITKTFGALIEEEFAKALKKEEDPNKRALADKVFKVMAPTLKSGEFDGAVSLRINDNQKATVVGGLKVKNGEKIETLVRDLIKFVPPGERDKIKLDVAKVGNVNIHRVQIDQFDDEKAQQLFGKNPAFVAVRNNAVLFALGKGGMAAIRKAIKSKPKAAPVVQFEFELGQLAHLDDKATIRAAAKQVFKNGKKGIVRATVRGGNALSARLEISLSVLEFAVKTNDGGEVGLDRPAVFEIRKDR